MNKNIISNNQKERFFQKIFNNLSIQQQKVIDYCLQEIGFNYNNNNVTIILRSNELEYIVPILQILCPSIQFHEIDSILFGNKFYWKPNDFYMPDSIEPYIWKNNNNPTFI